MDSCFIKLTGILKMGFVYISNLRKNFYCFFFRRYGGNRILTEEYGDMAIINFDVNTRLVSANALNNLLQERKTFFFLLPEHLTSDLALFSSTILARWQILQSWWVGDDDFTDYLPALFVNLHNVAAGKCIIIKDGKLSRFLQKKIVIVFGFFRCGYTFSGGRGSMNAID